MLLNYETFKVLQPHAFSSNAHTYTDTHTYIHTNTHTRTYMYTHTHRNTYTHIHTEIHIHSHLNFRLTEPRVNKLPKFLSWIIWNLKYSFDLVCSLSHWADLLTVLCFVAQSCPTLCDPPGTVACQAPLFMGFSRQEYWSGLPCPPPKALPNPRIKPRSPTLQANSLPSEPPGKQSPGLRGIHFLASLGFPGLIKLYLQSELTILQCLLSFGVAHFCCLCAH